MQRCLILLIVIINTIHCFGQYKFGGCLLDQDTKMPIPFASVEVIGATIGTISNEAGCFVLISNCPIKKVLISHLNYGKQELEISDAALKENSELLIKSAEIRLNEVVITNTPIPVILKNVTLKSQQQLSYPLFFEAYYREFVKRKEKYTKYSDGILKYTIEKNKKGDIETATWVEDSRVVELDDEEEEKIDLNLTSPLKVNEAFDITSLNFLLKYTEDEIIEKYEYKLSTQEDVKDGAISKIEIIPKKDLEELLKKVTIFYETESKLIVDVEIFVPEYNVQFFREINLLVLKLSITQWRQRIMFRHSADNYYPIYALKDFSMILRNKKTLNDELRFTSDVNVTELFSESSPRPALKARYKEKSLYIRKEPNKTEFWKSSNAIKLTEEQENIIEHLNIK